MLFMLLMLQIHDNVREDAYCVLTSCSATSSKQQDLLDSWLLLLSTSAGRKRLATCSVSSGAHQQKATAPATKSGSSSGNSSSITAGPRILAAIAAAAAVVLNLQPRTAAMAEAAFEGIRCLLNFYRERESELAKKGGNPFLHTLREWALTYLKGPEQGIKLLGLLLTGSTGQRMASRNGLA